MQDVKSCISLQKRKYLNISYLCQLAPAFTVAFLKDPTDAELQSKKDRQLVKNIHLSDERVKTLAPHILFSSFEGQCSNCYYSFLGCFWFGFSFGFGAVGFFPALRI